jgi:hypothetical protein
VAIGRQIKLPRRQRYLQRRASLMLERKSFEDVWRDCSDQILSRRTRFIAQDRNKKRRNTKIIDPTPRMAQETLVNFLMENMCSKSRQWYGLAPVDKEIAERPAVRDYTEEVTGILRNSMANSNFYSAVKTQITDLVVFGTACGQIDEDDDDVIRTYAFPVGQYLFANSARLQVDTVYRDLSMTVAQIVERFGFERCSPAVQMQWNNHQYDNWVEVLHVVEPNREYDPSRAHQMLGPAGQPWRSCYMELGGDQSRDDLLAEEGNFEFPMLASRWDVLGEDVYGTSPGMDALGVCTALQILAKRLASMMDKTVSPPMNAPTSALTRTVSTLSGDWNFYDVMSGGVEIKPSLMIPPQSIREAREEMAQLRQVIGKIFKNDVYLFNLRSQPGGENTNITATEATIRDQEKLQLMGAMTDRIEDELFEPAVQRILAIHARNGLLPKPPDELIERTADGRVVGKRLKVEYTSEMAQAKKAVALGSLQRHTAYVGQVTEIMGMPAAVDGRDPRDGVDFDQAIRSYAEALNITSKVSKPQETVDGERAAKAQAQQQAQQTALAQQQAKTAKDLSQAQVGGDNALGAMLSQGDGSGLQGAA